MAEGGFDPAASQRPTTTKIQQLCRYFMHGACGRGSSCRFVHDRTGSVPLNNVCKFYQQGRCYYGNECRYDHVRTSQTGLTEANTHTNSNRVNSRQQHSSSELSSTHTCQDSRRTRNESCDNWESSFVTLNKDDSHKSHKKEMEKETTDRKQSQGDSYKTRVFKKNWAKAKDFVPGQKFHAGASYANRVHDSAESDDGVTHTAAATPQEPKEGDLMCPYHAHGHCPYGEECTYVHGEVCEICQMPRLHPTNTVQREEHSKECLNVMEKDMEHSFAIQESQKKECCICLEIVLEKGCKELGGASKKTSRSNQFGILENCSHCFCLDCIRRWRSDKMSFGKNVRVCPACRVHSDFVTPSSVWVEEDEAKKKVIQDYKDALRLKPCQYFKQGKGECPFNEKCFYKHAYPDGTIASPKPRPKRRHQTNADGEVSAMEAMTLWDFLEVREDGRISLEDELSLYLLGLLEDSDGDDDERWLFGGLSDGTSSDSCDEFLDW